MYFLGCTHTYGLLHNTSVLGGGEESTSRGKKYYFSCETNVLFRQVSKNYFIILLIYLLRSGYLPNRKHPSLLQDCCWGKTDLEVQMRQCLQDDMQRMD